jgi:rubrerythrin
MFPDVPLQLPPSQLPAKAKTEILRGNLSLREALDIAIQAERHARDFYLDAANHVEDLTGKAMFKFLADMEYAHQMELTAQYDLLVKYPNYYDDVSEPWQEELGLRRQKI